jgi:DNA-binding SARP family transcriptional activator/LysM repeat protein
MSSVPYPLSAGGNTRRSAGRRLLGLLGLLATLTVGAAVLYRLAGPPHLPTTLPSWDATKAMLMGSDVPYQALAYLLSTAAWLTWCWIVGSILLRLLVAIAETLTRGAAWAHSLRLLSDRVTLPLIRKLVDGTVVAVTVVQLVGRTASIASAAPATPGVVMVHAAAHAASAAPAGQAEERRRMTYRVREGDNLWAIAERFYNDGSQFPRLINANVGRPMGNGQSFPPTGVIQQGWVLLIPDPTQLQAAAAPAAPQQAVYDVKNGDTLRAIAARYYGDERRWPEIFRANEGLAKLPDGRVLTKPDLIWPGLALTIPGVAPVKPVGPPSVSLPAHAPAPPAVPAPAIAPPPVPGPAHVVTHPPLAATAAAPTPAPIAVKTPATIGTALPAAALATPAATPVPHVPPVRSGPIPAMRGTAAIPAQVPLLPAGLAVLGAAGGVVLLARRRFRTSLSQPPVPPDHEAGIPIRAGWADPAHARTFAHRLDGGTEPALLVAEQVLHCLDEAGIKDVALVTVREGRHSMGLTLRAGLAAQQRLLQIAPELAERLGATGEARRTPDHDILLQLSHLALLRLAVRPSARPLSLIPLLALGVLPGGEAFHVNWRALGNVLIVSLPGGGGDIVLTNVLTTLAARCHPDQLRLYTVAAPEFLAPPLLELPHQCGPAVAPTDSESLSVLLGELRTELERRMQRGEGDGTASNTAQPDLVLVLGELADLPNANAAVEMLKSHGSAYGVHLVAATTRQEMVSDATLGSFGTRLVLRTPEEQASIRLLGRPEAADLGGGGDLYVRIEGREPLRLQSFRVEMEHLNRLVDLMHAAFRNPPPAEEPEAAAGADDDDNAADQAVELPLADEQATPTGTTPPLGVAANGSVLIAAASPTEASAAMPASLNGYAAAPPVKADPRSVESSGREDLAVGAARARIQIRCFGELAVYGDGCPLSEQGQYLPWELMILLALQLGAGMTKHELLRLLWPNTDQDLGGRRLRAAMVRLRDVLGAQVAGLPVDVVRNQRSGNCHLDTDLIWSDAQQFLALCQQARRLPAEQATPILEQAREMYGGELFTQPYFGWMDRRVRGLTLRERYREDYAEVTHQLAERYEAEGRPALAVPLYLELLHAQPTLQDVARRLYRCCAQLGDRNTLQREHARLVAALEQLSSTALPGQAHAYAPERDTIDVYAEALAALQGVLVGNSGP